MNIIRYLVFFPVCLLALGIINWAFGHLIIWFMRLSSLWLILVLIFFGGTIWGIFRALSAMFVALTSAISPNKNVSFLTITALSAINGIGMIYNSWTLQVDYSGKMIFAAIVFTILVIELTFALILGASTTPEQEY